MVTEEWGRPLRVGLSPSVEPASGLDGSATSIPDVCYHGIALELDECALCQQPVAIKIDGAKPRVDLLPSEPLIMIADVLGFGAKKYAEHNWRKGFDYSRLVGATMRHLLAFNDGEDNDPETGLSHLAHAGCEILFLLEHIAKGIGNDDRYRRAE